MWNLDIFTNNIIYALQVLIFADTILDNKIHQWHCTCFRTLYYIVLFVSLSAITEASNVLLICSVHQSHNMMFYFKTYRWADHIDNTIWIQKINICQWTWIISTLLHWDRKKAISVCWSIVFLLSQTALSDGHMQRSFRINDYIAACNSFFWIVLIYMPMSWNRFIQVPDLNSSVPLQF